MGCTFQLESHTWWLKPAQRCETMIKGHSIGTIVLQSHLPASPFTVALAQPPGNTGASPSLVTVLHHTALHFTVLYCTVLNVVLCSQMMSHSLPDRALEPRTNRLNRAPHWMGLGPWTKNTLYSQFLWHRPKVQQCAPHQCSTLKAVMCNDIFCAKSPTRQKIPRGWESWFSSTHRHSDWHQRSLEKSKSSSAHQRHCSSLAQHSFTRVTQNGKNGWNVQNITEQTKLKITKC